MRFSDKLAPYEESIFAELAALRQRLSVQGARVIDLSIGSPDQPPAPHVMQALAQGAQQGENYRYAVQDRPELLASVAAWYRRRFGVALDAATQITSLLGSQDGLAHIAQALLDVGDTVLTPDPGYPIFTIGPTLCGMRVERMPQLRANGYLVNLDAIPQDVARRAKLMILSYPNNPTSAVASVAYYQDLVAFAQANDIAVLHDNAYSELTFDGLRCGSFLQAQGACDVGVEFNSLSKTYNFAGARVGFALGNAQMVGLLRSLKSNLDFGVFLPVQLAAQAALDGPQDQVAATRAAYQARRDVLLDGLRAVGWDIPKPQATMFVWAPIPEGWGQARAFAMALAERTGVIVVPGPAFGPSGEGYVRMALVQPEESMREAVRRVADSGLLQGPAC
ncbi:MAG: aminotransferase class I/II-fold pyridoxal phosphate-dependent enzyme [Oscillospiraceae bacterium]|jgi:LL-diaminopimelate aminotransferase|nr:aminotransferase class I/II-fold pyridoxal phosphate-dependent enzyme [Oscillospiraceae bacterium]